MVTCSSGDSRYFWGKLVYSEIKGSFSSQLDGIWKVAFCTNLQDVMLSWMVPVEMVCFAKLDMDWIKVSIRIVSGPKLALAVSSMLLCCSLRLVKRKIELVVNMRCGSPALLEEIHISCIVSAPAPLLAIWSCIAFRRSCRSVIIFYCCLFWGAGRLFLRVLLSVIISCHSCFLLQLYFTSVTSCTTCMILFGVSAWE